MTRAAPQHPWSAPLSVHDVPETGRSVTLVADEKTRSAIAQLAGLRSLSRLEARFEVTPRGRDGLHVTGRVSATVGQTCVVTLEPIENEFQEDVDLTFLPPAAPAVVEEDGERIEVAAVDAPEPLTGSTIDLGAIVTESLVLGIDRYPRKPGAHFEPPTAAEPMPGPFVALAALKKTRNDEPK